MTRAFLSLVICAVTLVVGLATGALQSRNHARATDLDTAKRECDLLEAQIQDLEAETMRQRYALRWSFAPSPTDL